MRQRADVIGNPGVSILVKLADPGSSCGNCTGCIKFSGNEEEKDQLLEVATTIPVKEGDSVIIESTPKALLQVVAILYGIPFSGLVVGYLITLYLSGSDPTAGLGALFGLIIGGLIARPIARVLATHVGKPTIVAKACSDPY